MISFPSHQLGMLLSSLRAVISNEMVVPVWEERNQARDIPAHHGIPSARATSFSELLPSVVPIVSKLSVELPAAQPSKLALSKLPITVWACSSVAVVNMARQE